MSAVKCREFNGGKLTRPRAQWTGHKRGRNATILGGAMQQRVNAFAKVVQDRTAKQVGAITNKAG
jgi:hypothetical protein